MNEKDIRIGNSLLLYSEVVKVTEIGFKGDDYYLRVEGKKNGYYIDQFEPIELTEEILLKCGFEKSTDIDCYDINKLDNVIIYSGASILGGDTVIGEGAVIGGNAFIVRSVPARTIVRMLNQEVQYNDGSGMQSHAFEQPDAWFYEI